MANLTIGPHLARNGHQGFVIPELEHTGWSLEFAGGELGLNLPIYRVSRDWRRGKTEFSDYLIDPTGLPFAPDCFQFQVTTLSAGVFVSLDSVAGAIYRQEKASRLLPKFLEELREHLPINACSTKRRVDGASLIHPKFAAEGFEVIDFFAYGRSLSVEIGWVFPQDRKNPDCLLNLFAARVEFRPKPNRTLGEGKWMLPMPVTLSYQLAKVLKSLHRGRPVGILSERGKEVALEQFKWTRVSLLTVKEARQARIDFVRQHPELWNKPQELAKALLAAELYSKTTAPYNIRKQLPKLLREAGVG